MVRVWDAQCEAYGKSPARAAWPGEPRNPVFDEVFDCSIKIRASYLQQKEIDRIRKGAVEPVTKDEAKEKINEFLAILPANSKLRAKFGVTSG